MTAEIFHLPNLHSRRELAGVSIVASTEPACTALVTHFDLLYLPRGDQGPDFIFTHYAR